MPVLALPQPREGALSLGAAWRSFLSCDCRKLVFSSWSRPCRSLTLLVLISSCTQLNSSCTPLVETDLSCTAPALEWLRCHLALSFPFDLVVSLTDGDLRLRLEQ